ncbi:MAG: hypothetical protein LBV37_01510 [Mycoplasmataceae bacterium]|nr:hypothetical protein [Mycoplasmataceae bacterium]
MSFYSHQAHITKNWITVLYVFLVFIMFILIYVLVGEPNVLSTNWLVANKGIAWHGKVSNINVANWIYSTYHNQPNFSKYTDGDAIWDEFKGQTINVINEKGILFNPLILTVLLPVLVLANVVPFMLRLFKVMGLDVMPFSAACAISMFLFIISGLIPGDINVAWRWVVRLLILLLSLFLSFILFNYLLNVYFLKQPYAYELIAQMKQDALNKKDVRDSLKTLTEEYKKHDNVEYIDVEHREAK